MERKKLYEVLIPAGKINKFFRPDLLPYLVITTQVVRFAVQSSWLIIRLIIWHIVTNENP